MSHAREITVTEWPRSSSPFASSPSWRSIPPPEPTSWPRASPRAPRERGGAPRRDDRPMERALIELASRRPARKPLAGVADEPPDRFRQPPTVSYRHERQSVPRIAQDGIGEPAVGSDHGQSVLQGGHERAPAGRHA